MRNFVVDIGGTSTKFALIDDNYQIIKHEVVNTPKSYEKLLKLIIGKQNNYNTNKTIYISCPSAYSYEKKCIIGSSALKYIVGKDIVSDLGSNVVIENDANCALYGEYAVGNAMQTESSAMFTIGTGVGGSFMIGGNIYSGKNFLSGEFGYMLIDNVLIDSHFKSLGGKSSTANIIKNCKEVNENIKTGYDIFNNLDDPKVSTKLDEAITYLALGIINVQYIIDPEVIIISGAISKNIQFMELVKSKVTEILSLRPLYVVEPKIVSAKLGNEAHLIGALYKGKSLNNK